jgi:ABC-2 type transport system permease protein
MQETRATGLGGPTPRERLNAYRQELLTRYGVGDVAELPVYWVSASMQKLEEMDHEVYDHYYQGLNRVYRQQQRLQDRLGVLSPGLPLSSISMGLAGTDLLHHQEFVQAAEVARRAMVAKVNGYLNEMAVGFNRNLRTDASVSIESNDRVLIADEEIFRMVDPFHYSPPTVRNVVADYRESFVLLGLWLVLTAGFATISATRVRPAGR